MTKGEMTLLIKEINKELAWGLRHKVMWPHKPFEYVILENDDISDHYGLFLENTLASVLTLSPSSNKRVQIRKFATLTELQGQGYGTALLNWVLLELHRKNLDLAFLNARENKVNFYRRFGFVETSTTFVKSQMAYVVMEKEIK